MNRDRVRVRSRKTKDVNERTSPVVIVQCVPGRSRHRTVQIPQVVIASRLRKQFKVLLLPNANKLPQKNRRSEARRPTAGASRYRRTRKEGGVKSEYAGVGIIIEDGAFAKPQRFSENQNILAYILILRSVFFFRFRGSGGGGAQNSTWEGTNFSTALLHIHTATNSHTLINVNAWGGG
jgi:hypothetical protein